MYLASMLNLLQHIAGGFMPKIKNKTAGSPYKTISEAAEIVGVPQYVLRFWEGEFRQIQPQRINGRRMYDQKNLDIILEIKHMLYTKGYTIAGAKDGLKEPQQKNAETTSALILRLKNIRSLLS